MVLVVGNDGYPPFATTTTTTTVDKSDLVLLRDEYDLNDLTDGRDALSSLVTTVAAFEANFTDRFAWNETMTTVCNDTVASVGGNNNDVDLPHDAYYFYKTEQLIFLSILFTMIVLGNSAVLIALMLSKNKKSRMNFFIMQLAIADLAVGLISVLTDIIWKITIAWHAGNIACKIVRYVQVLVTYSSTYVLVALSVDRYDAITHPMNFSGSWKRARWLIVIAWTVSAVFSLPILVLYEERMVNGHAQCWIELPSLWHWKVYMTLVAVALFIVPTIVITACYTIIVYTIWSKGKTLTPKKLRSKGSSSNENDADTKRASSRGLIPKAKIKTIKMTFSIVFVFILCWSPYIIYDLLQVYGYIPVSQTNMAVATFVQSLAPLNSAANPIIYCLFSTHICHNMSATSSMVAVSSSSRSSPSIPSSWKIPIVDWLMSHVCLCCPSVRRPLQRDTASMRRSDYTTMSESVSRCSRRSNSTTAVGANASVNRRYGTNAVALTSMGPTVTVPPHNRKYIVACNGNTSRLVTDGRSSPCEAVMGNSKV